MKYRKLTGKQGQFVTTCFWEDGSEQELATAPAAFIDWRTMEYRQEYAEEMQKAPAKFSRWREALEQHRKVVVIHEDWKADGSVTRDRYIGVWDIEDLLIGDSSHSFHLVRRYKPSQGYSSR